VPEPADAGYSDGELEQLIARLSALASDPPPSTTAAELAAIRAHLRFLAADNNAVGSELRKSLGLESDDPLQ